MQETQVQSLGWEDPLGKETATGSRILAWRIPWTGEPGGLQKEILMMGYINICSVYSIAATWLIFKFSKHLDHECVWFMAARSEHPNTPELLLLSIYS